MSQVSLWWELYFIVSVTYYLMYCNALLLNKGWLFNCIYMLVICSYIWDLLKHLFPTFVLVVIPQKCMFVSKAYKDFFVEPHLHNQYFRAIHYTLIHQFIREHSSIGHWTSVFSTNVHKNWSIFWIPIFAWFKVALFVHSFF